MLSCMGGWLLTRADNQICSPESSRAPQCAPLSSAKLITPRRNTNLRDFKSHSFFQRVGGKWGGGERLNLVRLRSLASSCAAASVRNSLFLQDSRDIDTLLSVRLLQGSLGGIVIKCAVCVVACVWACV